MIINCGVLMIDWNKNVILHDLLSPLSDFLNDESVQEIMVNKPTDVWVERGGEMTQYIIPEMDEKRLYGLILALGRLTRKDIHDDSPIVDTRLGKHRVAACLAPVAVHGHAMCIRKHGNVDTKTSDYANYLSSTEKEHALLAPVVNRANQQSIEDFLQYIVSSKKNYIISGGTSSGKTSFFRALLKHLPQEERVITVEDPPELRLQSPNSISFEVNKQIGVDIRMLVHLCMRFRPDRLFVGEIRGKEAYDFLTAANSGHDGTGCSLHANNPTMALEKFSEFARDGAGDGSKLDSIKNQVAYTFDYVVQMGRVKGQRTITSIQKVLGHDGKDFLMEDII
jgi:Flp pilus assembly CpaF family ATPase